MSTDFVVLIVWVAGRLYPTNRIVIFHQLYFSFPRELWGEKAGSFVCSFNYNNGLLLCMDVCRNQAQRERPNNRWVSCLFSRNMGRKSQLKDSYMTQYDLNPGGHLCIKCLYHMANAVMLSAPLTVCFTCPILCSPANHSVIYALYRYSGPKAELKNNKTSCWSCGKCYHTP